MDYSDQKRINIFFGAVIIIILAIIGLMVFDGNNDELAYQPVNNVVPPVTNNVVTKTVEPIDVPEELSDEMADWKLYENKELGFSFRYPSEFGDFNLSIENGENGKIFRGGFPNYTDVWANNKFFTIGGITQDYGQGRSGYFLDFVRYIKTPGKYYHLMAQNKKYEFTPLKIISIDDQEVLIVDGNSYPGNKVSELGFGPGINGGALVNLPSNGEFSGLAMWNSDIKKLPQVEFEKIISTFKFYR